MFTDTHSHPYYADESSLTAREQVRKAIDAGVNRIIMPNVDLQSIAPMKELATAFPDNLRMAMGLHPTEVRNDADEVLTLIEAEANNGTPYVAIGEIGIDLYWDKTYRREQMDAFDRQLNMAARLSLPAIIHCREALDEVLEVLESHPGVPRVFHSFGGSHADAQRILRQSDHSYFGINGIVTFKNSSLRSVIPYLPTERLLLETDSPYLAPVPYRGKPNQSAYLPYIATEVAGALNSDIETIANITSSNSQRLFGF